MPVCTPGPRLVSTRTAVANWLISTSCCYLQPALPSKWNTSIKCSSDLVCPHSWWGGSVASETRRVIFSEFNRKSLWFSVRWCIMWNSQIPVTHYWLLRPRIRMKICDINSHNRSYRIRLVIDSVSQTRFALSSGGTLLFYVIWFFRYLCFTWLLLFLVTFYFCSLHLYKNICTFYSLHWNNNLVTLFKMICCCCLKWSYFKLFCCVVTYKSGSYFSGRLISAASALGSHKSTLICHNFFIFAK